MRSIVGASLATIFLRLEAGFFFAATFRFGAALRFAVFRFAGLRPFFLPPALGRDAFFFLFAAMRVLRMD